LIVMGSWLRNVAPRPHAAVRLVCFPHAGGSASVYRPWQRMSPAIEVHAVQYPGRADRINDDIVDDATTMVHLLLPELIPLFDRPVALFGHSVGALVAYEAARTLEARRTPPVHLFVSGSPSADDRARPRFSALDDHALVGELAAMGGTETELLNDPEIRNLVLPYVRGDLRLADDYRHEPYPPLSAPITSLLGDADPLVTPEQAARWAKLTSGPFDQRVLPGDHFYLISAQGDVIAEIETRLAVAASG
jgi:surfactin synthase thioesterase subunit